MRNNHWSRMLTAVLTALVLLAGSLMGAAAEGTDAAVVADLTGAEEPVLLASVNGDEIWSNNGDMLQMVEAYADYLASYGVDLYSDPDTYAKVRAIGLNWAIDSMLYKQKATELGISEMTDEQKAEIEKEALASWDSKVEEFASSLSGLNENSSEEEIKQAKENAISYIEENYGYTEEKYVSEYVEGSWQDQMRKNVQEAVLGKMEVSDEEVVSRFNELVKSHEEMYRNNEEDYVSDFETSQRYPDLYEMYGGEPLYYYPEGYRGITHILLRVDKELLDSYTSLQAKLEEQKEEEKTETPEETTGETEKTAEGETVEVEPEASTTMNPEETMHVEPVTQEQVDAAKQAILDSVQAQVDEILAKYAAGTSFRELIAQYGTDPGMLSEQARQEYVDESSFKDLYAKYGLEMLGENAENGYAVHKHSINWDPAFRDGAMKLEKIGDVSEPVLGSNGIHLLHYTRDIPAGAVELTEALRDQLKEEILSEKESTAVAAMVEEWRNAAEIIYTPEGQAILDAANNQNEESVETTEATEETLADGE